MSEEKPCLPCQQKIDPEFLKKMKDEKFKQQQLQKAQEFIPTYSHIPKPAAQRGVHVQHGEDGKVIVHTSGGPNLYKVISQEGNQLTVRYEGPSRLEMSKHLLKNMGINIPDNDV